MKNVFTKVAVFSALMSFAVVANAEGRTVEIWKCKANEGMSLEDVHKANSKWVKYMNANIEGGDINSYVLRSIVGMSGTFMYVDSFPSMASWSAAKEHESKELSAIEEELEAAAECSKNTLHNSVKS